MAAWGEKRDANRRDDVAARTAAKLHIDGVKIALGERGPVWWSDGAPDFNRHLVRNTPYCGTTIRVRTGDNQGEKGVLRRAA
jgi:hypothetical protein